LITQRRLGAFDENTICPFFPGPVAGASKAAGFTRADVPTGVFVVPSLVVAARDPAFVADIPTAAATARIMTPVGIGCLALLFQEIIPCSLHT